MDASVIVRAKNKEDTIERTLSSLRRQTVPVEIVLVDSGSADRTVVLARRHCDRIVHLDPSEFSYGGALNVGAGAASGEIHFALSAHCAPVRRDWVELSLAHYANPLVAATNGAGGDPRGNVLDGPYAATLADVACDPYWGFSNHASSWRREVWESHPFDETMVACEDKEWAWRVMKDGYVVVFDPELTVSSEHRRRAGLRALYSRTYREASALRSMIDFPTWSLADATRIWWSHFPYESPRPTWVRRFSPMRLAEIGGRYLGEQAGRRRLRNASDQGRQSVRL